MLEVDPTTLEEYDRFINHDRYRNTVQITETKLLTLKLLRGGVLHMEEIHRKVVAEAIYRVEDATKYSSERRRASRTLHNQIAAIFLRYYQVLHKNHDAEYMSELSDALLQAHLIDLRAKYRVSKLTEERTKGNVRFVKSL